MVHSPLVQSQKEFRKEIDRLSFSLPVTHVYNPIGYAWEPYKMYLSKYGGGTKMAVFLGMNPGPWGMVQTGIPFGEINAVTNWLAISGKVAKPPRLHPKRPIDGFSCSRHEISGLRLWGLFRNRYQTAGRFFKKHFVLNYCPLAFFDEKGKNITPDKLSANESNALLNLCDLFLVRALCIIQPRFVVGIGRFAESRIVQAIKTYIKKQAHKINQTARWDPEKITVAHILHPSPASPAANRGWEEKATRQLIEQGVWKESEVRIQKSVERRGRCDF
ncbi:MAG: single-stranded DNA-binding protein [Spirochaetales bacterium]|nr:single-stranded DNA-binding protein [Spirochaetales bacterium]